MNLLKVIVFVIYEQCFRIPTSAKILEENAKIVTEVDISEKIKNDKFRDPEWMVLGPGGTRWGAQESYSDSKKWSLEVSIFNRCQESQRVPASKTRSLATAS